MLSETLVKKIKKLKQDVGAVILAHTYQKPEIQELADYVGDSLGLSLQVKKSNVKTIIFCGVRFMAETAKIISPEKTVLLPNLEAGCPMADMITVEQLQKLKKDYPGYKIVCYVNSSAQIKAESDICCTSSNAVRVVASIPAEEPVIFIPDMNLGNFVKKSLSRENMVIWKGFCHVHYNIHKKDVQDLKNKYPEAVVLVHPECREEVITLADYVLSTNGMIEEVASIDKKEFIVVTESGILYPLMKKYPDKKFYVIEKMLCPNMKKIDVESLLASLENNQYQINLPEDIIAKANRSVSAMLAL